MTPIFLQKNFKLNQRGMTLIEIMIVLVIIGGLATVLAVNVTDRLEKSKVEQAKMAGSQILQALSLYYGDCGSYPPDAVGLNALVENKAGCKSWGPTAYLKADKLEDPWKNKFEYHLEGETVTVRSLGRDRKEGGTEFGADIEIQN